MKIAVLKSELRGNWAESSGRNVPARGKIILGLIREPVENSASGARSRYGLTGLDSNVRQASGVGMVLKQATRCCPNGQHPGAGEG